MNKIIQLLVLILTVSICDAQSLPIDFESSVITDDFIDFDGGTATVIDNPQSNGINTSSKVAQIVRSGGQIWAGSKIGLDANLDFTSLNSISMKVYTSAPVGTTVKFKLEGDGETERDVLTTISNEWETLTWDFTGEPMNFVDLVFMFDFGNVGDGSETSTFLFDDIQQLSGGSQIDLPVDFENPEVNYTTTDFGGNISSLETDPEDSSNTVVMVIKTIDAATWAGTTIGTNAGFATDIPLSLTDSKMTVKVWSPQAGTPIRLKVEDSDDPTHTCETETNTTVSGGWEVMEFDFLNQAPGTESLSVGLSMGWTYNMASLFFNFGTEGQEAGEQIYYFDDVMFGELVNSIDLIGSKKMLVFPNPSYDHWNIVSQDGQLHSVELFDVNGNQIFQSNLGTENVIIDNSEMETGVFYLQIQRDTGLHTFKLIKI